MENQQIQKRRSQYIFLKNQVSPLLDDNIYDEEAQKTSIYKAGKKKEIIVDKTPLKKLFKGGKYAGDFGEV